MKHGLKWIIVALLFIIIGLLVWLAYDTWQDSQQLSDGSAQEITTFESCVSAGNQVMETSPRQCRDSETGVTYTEKIDEDDADSTPTTHRYKSEDGVSIELSDWTEGREIESPFTLSGKVPGSWSFEASFPVELRDSDNKVIAEGAAELQDDWMTEAMVPFTVTLTFDDDLSDDDASLILLRSNPSGLPENDDSLTLDAVID